MSEIVNTSAKAAVKGTAFVLLGTAGSYLAGFFLKLLIVRNTSTDEFGIYSLAVAVISIISYLTCLGLQEAVPRNVASSLGEGMTDKARAVSRSAVRIGIISGLTASFFLFLFSDIVSARVFYKPELASPLSVISFYILFFVMSQIVSGILRGHNIIQQKVYYLDIGFPLCFLVVSSICILLGCPLIGIFYAYLFSMICIFGLTLMYGYKKIGSVYFFPGSVPFQAELLRFSIPLLISSLMVMIFNWTDTLMLGRYSNSESVGLYNISITLASSLTFPLGALGFVFMPLAADMYTRGQHAELKRIYQVLTKWIFSVTLPVFFVLFLFPEMTISFLFGERFIDSAGALRILSLGFLIQSFLGASGQLMVVKGLSNTLMKISIIGAILNIMLNYIFIKQLNYGIIGASLATMISYSIIPAASAIIIYRETSIHPITSEYIKPVISSVIIGTIIYVIAKALPLYLWMLPLYLFAFVGGYIVSLFLAKSIEKEDIMLFESVLQGAGVKMKIISRYIRKV